MSVPYETDWLAALAKNDRLLLDDDAVCWPWGGYVGAKGYGTVNNRLAHRVVYELVNGPIPDGLMLDHLCRNRCCVNPAHLEAVTMKVNYDRGEGWRGLALGRGRKGDETQ